MTGESGPMRWRLMLLTLSGVLAVPEPAVLGPTRLHLEPKPGAAITSKLEGPCATMWLAGDD